MIPLVRLGKKIRIPWIFKYGLNLHKPNYKIGFIDLGLEKRSNLLVVYWITIIALGLFFGGFFMVVYEFTPPLIQAGGGATMIYPGLSRETFAEFLMAVAAFITGALGLFVIREAPRREEEAWTTYMYVGLVLFIVMMLVIMFAFMSKVGMIR